MAVVLASASWACSEAAPGRSGSTTFHATSCTCPVAATVQAPVPLQGLLPLPAYFASEWSFAQFRLPEPGRAYAGFVGDEERLLVVTQAGSFFRLKWSLREGRAMEQELYEAFAEGDIPRE